MKTDFLNFFTMFIGRLVRDNPNIKYYGINILFFFSPRPDAKIQKETDRTEKIKTDLFSVIHTWCASFISTTGVVVTFDFIDNQGDLAHVLRNELRRVTHGDMMAQCSGVY